MRVIDLMQQEFPRILAEKVEALTKQDFSGGDLHGTEGSWRATLTPMCPEDFRWTEMRYKVVKRFLDEVEAAIRSNAKNLEQVKGVRLILDHSQADNLLYPTLSYA